MKKGSKCLTWVQRLQIETLINAKHKVSEIAEMIGVNQSTIYRELKRGQCTFRKTKYDIYGDKIGYTEYVTYSAEIAHQKYCLNLTAKGRNIKLGKDYEFVRYVENKVQNEHLTPHAIIGEINKKNLPYLHISFTTLYRYIRLGIFSNLEMSDILKSQKKHYEKTKAKRAPKGTSIEKRPDKIAKRIEFGHWEMDCVCGPTTDSLLVFTERQTRKEIIFKIPNQKSESVIKCLNVLERRYGTMFRKVFKTITVDNGSEFSNFKKMESSRYGRGRRVQIFYCHPYSSWERGSNERMNREIRRRLPKGTDFSKVSIETLQEVERWINRYPRSVLGYCTSEELFQKQIANL